MVRLVFTEELVGISMKLCDKTGNEKGSDWIIGSLNSQSKIYEIL